MRTSVMLMTISCFAAFAEGPHAQGAITLAPGIPTLQTITEKLKSGEVSRLDIFEMPARLFTRTRVTPDILERQFSYKLTVADVQSWQLRDRLLARLQAETISPTERLSDLRWDLIFYDIKDVRVGGIYFDRTGRVGYVDTLRVTFSGPLFNLLQRKLTPGFR
jgi:hypothetical protein